MTSESQEIWSLKVDKDGVVWLGGEVDYTATPKLRISLLKYLEKVQDKNIVINLSRLTYLDSSGLAALIEIRKKLVDLKGVLKIVAVTPEVKKIFDLTQVSQLFGL